MTDPMTPPPMDAEMDATFGLFAHYYRVSLQDGNPDAVLSHWWSWHLAQVAEARAEAVRECVRQVQARITTLRDLCRLYPSGDTEYGLMIEECEEIEVRLTALLPPEPGQRKEGVEP